MRDKKLVLNEKQISEIKKLDVPTIANCLELVEGLRLWTEGFTKPEIKCCYPEFGTSVGYAATVEIAAENRAEKPISRDEYWEYIMTIPEPRLIVVKDRDYPNVIGSFWGEVNGNIAKGLGAVGVVTDGGVRDINEVRKLGFQFLAKEILVSHAYVHIEALNTTVDICGMSVSPGDLIASDQHGAIQIPIEVARIIPKLAREMENYERPMIKAASTPNATPDTLREAAKKQEQLRSNKSSY